MPQPEPSRRYRRERWWRDYREGETGPEQPSEASEHVARMRPPWWPENEPWPPARRYWARGTHRPFFRRLGCLFMLLNLVGAFFIVYVVILGLNGLGVTSIVLPHTPWILPVGGILLGLTVSAVIYAGANLRRVSMPLDDLLAASHRVADGDYSVRVSPRGPLEVRSLAAAFNSMAEQLDAHDRQRRTMLADVSHELRTPLTVIQGNVEGMLDGMYATDENRLRSILEETQILSRLTDDLRTLSLAESGTLQLKRESTDLAALARETIQAFQSQADAGGVKIELSAAPGEDLADVDPERIRQVLSNLISNAVRYSPRGSSLRVDLSRSNVSARVAVTDSGPGIAAADLPHIFDRYYKSADSRGMGLGLSIAKYLVEAHGGQIGAESRPEGGSTIWFTLPG